MGDSALDRAVALPTSARTSARHGASELESLLGALTTLVPILLGGAGTTSRQTAALSGNAARTESDHLGIFFEQLEAVTAGTIDGPGWLRRAGRVRGAKGAMDDVLDSSASGQHEHLHEPLQMLCACCTDAQCMIRGSLWSR